MSSVFTRSPHAGSQECSPDIRRKQPEGSSQAAPLTQCLFLILWLSAPLSLYYLALLEVHYNLLFNFGSFMKVQRLSAPEVSLFLGVYFVELPLLLYDAALGLRFLLVARRWRRAWLIDAGVVLALFVAVNIQSAVFSYFKDSFGLGLMRVLGGGSFWVALRFAADQAAGRWPLLAIPVCLVLISAYVIRHGQSRLLPGFAEMRAVRWLTSRRGLAVSNLVVLVLPVILASFCPYAQRALLRGLPHQIFTEPAKYLTDFDFDGYSMVSTPPDFAPFDSRRHPYAIDIPGNGIDEDGIGGDLPAVTWKRTEPDWAPEKLARKNVILVVLESARADAERAVSGGQQVMPFLHSLPGHSFTMVSHAGHTAASVTALLNGTLAVGETPYSLLEIFRKLGYTTAAISGQDEGFGEIAASSRMPFADFFADATRMPPASRMYASRAMGSMAMPYPVVNSVFGRWLEKLPGDRPFFAYVNYQEMHFPYHYSGGPTPLAPNPIPKGKITAENRQWLLRTYWNAARGVDDGLAELFGLLTDKGVLSNTIVAITGDHGEELFDNGYLGHGKNMSFEENTTVAKLVNAPALDAPSVIGERDLRILLYDSLVRQASDRMAIPDETLCYTGEIDEPIEIGLISRDRLVKYNFWTNHWRGQRGFGAPEEAWPAEMRAIQLWESYRYLRSREGRTKSR